MTTTKPDVTISLRCYGRPTRTIRAVNSILQQTRGNFELLITGDACPNFQTDTWKYLMDFARRKLEERGCTLKWNNNPEHTGGCGYAILNQHIQDANGWYFMILSNDDVLLPNHVENYYSKIKATFYDWVYFDSWVEPNDAPRNAQLKEGMIGHSELIVKTSYLQKMPPHGPNYGHDWDLVKNLMEKSVLFAKAIGSPQTYIVKSIPGREEQGID